MSPKATDRERRDDPAGLVEIDPKAQRDAAIVSILGGLILAGLYLAGWFLR